MTDNHTDVNSEESSERKRLSWLTSSRAKSLAVLLPSIGSAIAIVIAAFKPTGVEASAKAYELLKQEITEQRSEIMQLNKSLAELQAWVSVWRTHESRIFTDVQSKTSVATIVPSAPQVVLPQPHVQHTAGQTAAASSSASAAVADDVPPPPPAPTPPRNRSALPAAKDIGF